MAFLSIQVVFAGYSAESLAQRIIDCKPDVVITCNAVLRGAKPIHLKDIVDKALAESADNGVSVGMRQVCAVTPNSITCTYFYFDMLYIQYRFILIIDIHLSSIVIGMCLTYENQSAMKKEATKWQPGRDIWWQVDNLIFFSLKLI